MLDHQKNIALIICYFGKLPWYFNYFVHTCKYNSSIDFIIITDNQNWINDLPPNVIVVYKTLDEINSLAEKKLGFSTEIKEGYKLCDFKPVYGFLFPELLDGYDFWGHGDIDIIFGDIRNFITDEILKNHELISVRHDYITGYFLLFRNNTKMNTLFMKSKDYKKVLSSSIHYCFDETNFRFHEFSDQFQDKIYVPIQNKIESMMHVVEKLRKKKQLKTYFDFHVIEGDPGRLYWDQGKLYYRNRYEVLLYHMIRFKTIYKPEIIPQKISNSFSITPTRICHH